MQVSVTLDFVFVDLDVCGVGFYHYMQVTDVVLLILGAYVFVVTNLNNSLYWLLL